MSSYEIPSKRRVEVSIGVPDMLADAGTEKQAGMAHPDECYFLTFVDTPDKDDPDESFNSFTAQTTCLCALPQATAKWLQGGTEEEVQAALVGGHDQGEEHGH